MIKEIPKKIKVGDNWYSVEIVEALEDKYAMGSIEFTKRAIQLNSRSQSGKRYTPTEVKETFWHELVHAILVDMGEYRLNNKEQFVEQFAIRLSRAVKSARFK